MKALTIMIGNSNAARPIAAPSPTKAAFQVASLPALGGRFKGDIAGEVVATVLRDAMVDASGVDSARIIDT